MHSDSGDALVFEASRLKAAFATVVSGAIGFLVSSSYLAELASDPSVVRVIATCALAALLAGMFLASLLRLVFSPRLVVDHRGLRVEGGLRPTALAWDEVSRIDVLVIRGLFWLTVSGRKKTRMLFLQGWKLSPGEMKSRILQFREGIGHNLSPKDIASIVPEDQSDQRNRLRRQGMIIVVIAAVVALLSLGDTRQVGVQDLPPGMDFQWAVPPTYWGLALAAVALAIFVVGLIRWLWPVGKQANPPLLSTATEWTVLSLCTLSLFAAALTLFTWVAHPA